MVSAEPLLFALSMACRRLPPPLSLAFITVILAAWLIVVPNIKQQLAIIRIKPLMVEPSLLMGHPLFNCFFIEKIEVSILANLLQH